MPRFDPERLLRLGDFGAFVGALSNFLKWGGVGG